MPAIRKIDLHSETETIQPYTPPSTTNLPDGWRMVRFGDVVRNVDVAVRDPEATGIERVVGLDHLDPESLHIKRWNSIAEGTSFTRKFTTGQVLFGKRRAYQRKVAVAEFDGICSGDILVFEPEGDALLAELLPFIVQSDGFFDHALDTSAGSLSPRTRWRDLAEYRFALPPRDEQRRIAELLWAADEAVESYLNVVLSAKTAFVLALQNWTSGPNSLCKCGWSRVVLVECADILDNRRKPLNQFERSQIKGNIPYYGANGPIDYISDYIFDEEIVLVGEDGDHFYKWQDWSQSHLVSGKSWVNNHAHVFRQSITAPINGYIDTSSTKIYYHSYKIVPQ